MLDDRTSEVGALQLQSLAHGVVTLKQLACGPDVFTRMNRYGRHTLAAFDA